MSCIKNQIFEFKSVQNVINNCIYCFCFFISPSKLKLFIYLCKWQAEVTRSATSNYPIT